MITLPPNHHPRPAGMGYTCDRWYPNPAHPSNPDLPQLKRCIAPATLRLTIVTPTDCYQVKHCPACADWLRREAEQGATFEILAEIPL